MAVQLDNENFTKMQINEAKLLEKRISDIRKDSTDSYESKKRDSQEICPSFHIINVRLRKNENLEEIKNEDEKKSSSRRKKIKKWSSRCKAESRMTGSFKPESTNSNSIWNSMDGLRPNSSCVQPLADCIAISRLLENDKLGHEIPIMQSIRPVKGKIPKIPSMEHQEAILSTTKHGQFQIGPRKIYKGGGYYSALAIYDENANMKRVCVGETRLGILDWIINKNIALSRKDKEPLELPRISERQILGDVERMPNELTCKKLTNPSTHSTSMKKCELKIVPKCVACEKGQMKEESTTKLRPLRLFVNIST